MNEGSRLKGEEEEEISGQHVDKSKLDEAKKLVEEGWRPYWNKRRNLIVFKRGDKTKSIGLTYEPELYQKLLDLYKRRTRPEEYEEIERAIREARAYSRPIEKERIDRLAEYESLVTKVGRAALEVYSDVSVDPEQLLGKSPEERAEIKARAIIEVMKREHKPLTRKELASKAEIKRLIELLPSGEEEIETIRYFDHIAYTRLFMETMRRLSLKHSNPELFEEACEEWGKLMSDEAFMKRLHEWAAEKSGLKTLAKIREKEYLIHFEAERTGRSILELALELRAEWEEAKRRRESVDYSEPLP